MTRYAAFTFAPVQGFIEKSRKLRDLFGSSLILSYLSSQVVEAGLCRSFDVISPGTPNVPKGMPNRILFAGDFTAAEEEDIRQELQQHFFKQWKRILYKCREWVEQQLENDYPNKWQWEEEWTHWGNHAWELFWGFGDSIKAAMESLEESKLDRNWTGINWVGRGSSLSGADSIAWPELGDKEQYAPGYNFSRESKEIGLFYKKLAKILDEAQDLEKSSDGESSENSQEETEETEEETPEGKFIAPNEKLSVPEMTKRLVTFPPLAKDIGMVTLPGFKDLQRRPEDTGSKGQWTGWFMGDGDQVGNYLKSLSEKEDGAQQIKQFSNDMRKWGTEFDKKFPKKLGRVIYAGGDDFFGVIYNRKFSKQNCKAISGRDILDWLINLPNKWKQGTSEVTLSVGFVWAAPSVPLRDVLQHCREAEKQSKNKGRDRVTIRVLFNSGQYVEWTTPWEDLDMLKRYEDLDGNRNDKANWSHVYQDLAHLKSRHAFGLDVENLKPIEEDQNNPEDTISDFYDGILDFTEIYFPGSLNTIDRKRNDLFTYVDTTPNKYTEAIAWIDSMISVGWYLLSK